MQLKLEYRVKLVTPLHVGSGMGFARMVDDTLVRACGKDQFGYFDASLRLPYIPGSSIKGKARYQVQRLADTLGCYVCARGAGERVCKSIPCLQCRLFGSPFLPGGLRFPDAHPVEAWQGLARPLQEAGGASATPISDALSLVRQGNKLERATRTVQPDFLFSVEHTAEDLTFSGSIDGIVEHVEMALTGDAEHLPLEGWFLIMSLKMVDKLGGLKSRGLGRCQLQITGLEINGADLFGNLDDLLTHTDYQEAVRYYDNWRTTG